MMEQAEGKRVELPMLVSERKAGKVQENDKGKNLLVTGRTSNSSTSDMGGDLEKGSTRSYLQRQTGKKRATARVSRFGRIEQGAR